MKLKKLWVQRLHHLNYDGLAYFDSEYMIVHYWQWENNHRQRYMVNDKIFTTIDDLYGEVEATYGIIIATER